MTTATQTYPETQLALPIPITTHYRIVGSTRFKCIQPDCDGEHHFFCSCEH